MFLFPPLSDLVFVKRLISRANEIFAIQCTFASSKGMPKWMINFRNIDNIETIVINTIIPSFLYILYFIYPYRSLKYALFCFQLRHSLSNSHSLWIHRQDRSSSMEIRQRIVHRYHQRECGLSEGLVQFCYRAMWERGVLFDAGNYRIDVDVCFLLFFLTFHAPSR